MKNHTRKLDYYVGRSNQHPCLYNDFGTDITSIVFKALKKQKSHLLQYFIVRFDESAREYITTQIPPAFLGVVLNSIENAINNTAQA